MNPELLHKILSEVASGAMRPDAAMKRLKSLPFEDLGYAKIDTHRALRKGFPEVIFGEGKTPEQIAGIMKKLHEGENNVLVTRIDREKARAVAKKIRASRYDEASRTLTLTGKPVKITGKGTILIICAGTSDIPVAEEARATAQIMGNRVELLYDVGVAGIHRLLNHSDKLDNASVVIVVAGMEGALASVVGGLVAKPIIAVPTSVGYGVSLGGLTALMGMLNSCASGVTVVNIDNGFGAAYAASLINRN